MTQKDIYNFLSFYKNLKYGQSDIYVLLNLFFNIYFIIILLY